MTSFDKGVIFLFFSSSCVGAANNTSLLLFFILVVSVFSMGLTPNKKVLDKGGVSISIFGAPKEKEVSLFFTVKSLSQLLLCINLNSFCL